jgi:hypothetical protein
MPNPGQEFRQALEALVVVEFGKPYSAAKKLRHAVQLSGLRKAGPNTRLSLSA